jgi:excisionase family DNA binding protein
MAKRRRTTRSTSVAAEPVGLSPLAKLPALLTVAEFMRASRVSRNTAYAWVQDGRVPALRYGRTLRIPREALQAVPASR